MTPQIGSDKYSAIKKVARTGELPDLDAMYPPKKPLCPADVPEPTPRTAMQTVFCNCVEEVVQPFGETMPHTTLQAPYNPTIKRPQVLLPNALFTNKMALFEFLRASCANFPKISYSYFMKLWESFFWHVDIKSWNPFAKCHECVTLRSLWLSANNEELRQVAKSKQQAHRAQVSFLRKRMDMRAKAAIDNPELVGMLLMDGMDSNKTSVPSFK
jgi:hypothetical protein